jgi:glucose/arabinose dehydrogenase
MNKNKLIILTILFCFSVSSYSSIVKFKVEKAASGLGIPWGMSVISNTELVFTERGGKVGILNVDTGEYYYLQGVPDIFLQGQGGLLDVAKPKNYHEGWLYFTYVKPINGNGATTLARAKIIKKKLVEWQDLLVSDSVTDTDRHFGSRIAFSDKHVFFSIGDRGIRPNSQDLKTHSGSIIRLNMDGTVPEDNPFIKNNNGHGEIFSYGHRNPQGLFWDNNHEKLWSIEHGPRGGDEINLIKSGGNYGWPVISYGKEYWSPFAVGEGTSKKGMEQPVKHYVPSIAPSSLIIYNGKAFPEWQGSILAGALKMQHINIVKLSDSFEAIKETRILNHLNERVRALTQDNEGRVYFSTDSGNIYVIKPE